MEEEKVDDYLEINLFDHFIIRAMVRNQLVRQLVREVLHNSLENIH